MYEEHDCRIEASYNLPEWYNLSDYDRSVEVAHYRIRHALEYNKNRKQEEQAEANAAKKTRK